MTAVPSDYECLESFLKSHLPASDQKELSSELKKSFPLHKRPKTKTRRPCDRKPRLSTKPLTSKEKKKLGLNKLPKKGFKFNEMLSLHRVWKGYMKENLSEFKSKDHQGTRGAFRDTEALRMRVARADLHGALIKVTKTKCPSMMGMEGLLIMETKNTVQILTSKNELKIVPKKESSFSFVYDEHLFTVGGSAMIMRPSERAVKKWKLKGPYDL